MPAVQPCALLLLVGPDWRVETASANVAMFGGVPAATVVGRPLSDLIGNDAIHTLRNHVSWLAAEESEVQDFGVKWADLALDVRATGSGQRYLIEAELAVEPRLADGIGMARSMTDRITGADPQQMAEQAIRLLQALTGFNRMALCDRHGEFIAGNDGKQSGLPGAADSTPRLVADRDSEPVPLVGDERASLLSRALYLAPDDRAVEALANQGIAATMALPLRIDGELVGTVHASHPSPRRCGAERRAVAQLFAERMAARMARHGWQP